MKLYKIYQNVNNDYDTYDSAVVCAENELEAVKIHPNGDYNYEEKEDGMIDKEFGTWAKKEYVEAELIGEADENIGKGVIVSSFNAG